ncbi:sigma-70 family RNA polymerase sigma factor [Nonomuraea sp. NPDC000554]|uniref:RNA polymerase sigma factor n=1 Tax=Nonomuraea sp. NPDC000554 TaxID=3154259 RepID=UPI0033264127
MSTLPAGTADHVDPARLPTLVRAAQRGDALAMQELLAALTPYVGRLAGPIALDDGQDAAQEALIVIFTSLRQLKEPAALFGWARAITVREAVRVARKASRARPAELDDVPDRGDPQLSADVRDVLERLTPEHRAVLTLRDLEGLDEQAIGELLALPAGTVKSRLFRARRSFRKEWDR